MDCIFKIHGIVPNNHICRGCEPLKLILRSVGCSDKESIESSRTILRAFQIIKLEDIFRDEVILKKLVAKASSIPIMSTLPKKMKKQLKTVNRKIIQLENSEIKAIKYVKEISKLGGSIFKSVAGSADQKRKLDEIGSVLTGALIVCDMNKDISNDFKNNKFNPFNKCSKETARSLTKQYLTKFTNFTQYMFPKRIMASNNIRGFGNLPLAFGLCGGDDFICC